MAERTYRFESTASGSELAPRTVTEREIKDDLAGTKLAPDSTPGDRLVDGSVDAGDKLLAGSVDAAVVGAGNLRVQNMDQQQLAEFVAAVVDAILYNRLKRIIRGVE